MFDRRLLTFTKAQVAWLKDEAKRLNIPMTELVRRLVDKARGFK